jgi:non-specific serine/threonine protein kinase
VSYLSKDLLLHAEATISDELPAGTVLCNGQYTVEEFLNSGGFGMTYLARDSLDRKVVLKECFPDAICRRSGERVILRSGDFEEDFARAVDLFQKEARALARLQHPNIVGVHQIFQANGTAYMALDYVNGVDLADLMESHPDYLAPSVVKSLLISLLKALTYVHENGILHRDISPDNILLDTNGTPVLIDFGAARQNATKASRVLSRVQTVKDGYSPQEFYFAGTTQSPSSDLYALAATIYHLITGAAPPNSSLRMAAMVENRTDPYQKLSGRFIAYEDGFIASIDKCLNLFAKDRIQSAQEWLRAIGPRKPGALPDFAPPPVDPEIDKKISELVACNHQALEEDRARRKETPETEKARLSAEEERLAAERAYWAILNEDSSEAATCFAVGVHCECESGAETGTHTRQGRSSFWRNPVRHLFGRGRDAAAQTND